jgi:hypothetical protein
MEKQEFAQMMEILEQFLARLDANTKTMREEMKTNKEEMLADMKEEMKADRKAWREEIRAETEAIRSRTEAMREERMKANMDACMADIKDNREEMAKMTDWGEKLDAWPTDIKDNREETMACQVNMEARLEEKDKPASMDMTPKVAHEQGVPLEDAEEMPVGEPRKRRRDRRNLAAVRRQKREQDENLGARLRKKEQNRTLRKDGCRRNLVAARRGRTRRVQVARRNFPSTKDTTREYCGSRKGLVAAHRGTTRHAKVARRTAN